MYHYINQYISLVIIFFVIVFLAKCDSLLCLDDGFAEVFSKGNEKDRL